MIDWVVIFAYFHYSKRRTEAQNVRLHFGRRRRYEIHRHQQLAAEPSGAENSADVPVGAQHRDQFERHRSGDNGLEGRRDHVLSGKCRRTVADRGRVDPLRTSDIARESGIHVVVGSCLMCGLFKVSI